MSSRASICIRVSRGDLFFSEVGDGTRLSPFEPKIDLQEFITEPVVSSFCGSELRRGVLERLRQSAKSCLVALGQSVVLGRGLARWARRRLNATKDSPTIAISIVPMAIEIESPAVSRRPNRLASAVTNRS